VRCNLHSLTVSAQSGASLRSVIPNYRSTHNARIIHGPVARRAPAKVAQVDKPDAVAEEGVRHHIAGEHRAADHLSRGVDGVRRTCR